MSVNPASQMAYLDTPISSSVNVKTQPAVYNADWGNCRCQFDDFCVYFVVLSASVIRLFVCSLMFLTRLLLLPTSLLESLASVLLFAKCDVHDLKGGNSEDV